jgi:hypothetical protein
MMLKQLNFMKLSVRQRQQVNLTCIYACPMKGILCMSYERNNIYIP